MLLPKVYNSFAFWYCFETTSASGSLSLNHWSTDQILWTKSKFLTLQDITRGLRACTMATSYPTVQCRATPLEPTQDWSRGEPQPRKAILFSLSLTQCRWRSPRWRRHRSVGSFLQLADPSDSGWELVFSRQLRFSLTSSCLWQIESGRPIS